MQLDKEDLKELAESLGEAIENIDIYVAAGQLLLDNGKEIVQKCRPLLAGVVKELIKLGIDLEGDIKPQLMALSLLKAKSRFRDYQNYKKAGFSATQAFVLVLASIKPINFSEILSSASKSLKMTSKTSE